MFVPLSCPLEHVTKAVAACIILYNMAIDDNMPMSKPLTIEIRIGDCNRPLRQDRLTVAPRGLKKHPNTSHIAQITRDLAAQSRGRVRVKRV